MASESPLSYPKFKAFDTDGTPLVGGKVYSYAAGGDTPKNTYSNPTLTTPNTNPVTLDSQGEAVIYLDTAAATKIVLKDSAGVTLWTMDNLWAGADTKYFADNAVAGAVLLTGNQTVAGVKTFSSFPVTPSSAPTTNYQTANKKFVDDSIAAIPASIGYALNGRTSSPFTNPLDATTYYLAMNAFNITTPATTGRIYIPKAGTVTKCYGFFNQTAGSNETSTLYLRLNNDSDTTVSTAITNDASITTFSNTALSITVGAGDYLEFKWTTPTWVTNPASILFQWVLFIE